MLFKQAPTDRQAIALWLYATGMQTAEIAKHLEMSKGATAEILRSAQELARAHRIWFISTKGKEEVPPNAGSGMSYLKQLALDAGLKTK